MTDQNQSSLRVEGLHRRFKTSIKAAVDHANLEIAPGEIHALTGESGSGNSTLLRIIAGFERSSAGSIVLNGKTLFDIHSGVSIPAEKRNIGLVFQDHALFPHLTVAENIAYGLKKKMRTERVTRMLDLVHLAPYANHYPHRISGGQAQRVALARALAPQPELLLMDEPFNSLDRRLKRSLLPEIRRIIKAANVPALVVSHDRDEVYSLAERISIIREGSILQSGKPEELYERPRSCYVAEFFGEANFLKDGDRTLMIRPEYIGISAKSEREYRGRIIDEQYRGDRHEYRIEISQGRFSGQFLTVRDYVKRNTMKTGQACSMSFAGDQLIEISEDGG
jgi:iron(III) transport system ATP-binding protein